MILERSGGGTAEQDHIGENPDTTQLSDNTAEGGVDSGRGVQIGAREYALEILDELERLIEALRAGCESATEPETLSRRQEHVQRAIELREKLLIEIEKLPSARDDEPP